jgi:tetratricopeptide (TPR) repeat protein
VNFKTPGTYYVKAHYGESKETTDFEFVDSPKPSPSSTQNSRDPVPKPKPQVTQPTPNQQETKPVEYKPQKAEPVPKQTTKEPEREPDNLSVEDKQLGEMLNEITLNCDYSDYADTIVYYDGMGPALMRLCNYEQAISYFDKSLIKEPENVEVITNKATAYSKLGKIDLALEYYDIALGIDPNYLPALNNKANVLAQLGKLEEAILIYNSILDENPEYSISQDNLQKARENLVEYAKSKVSDKAKSSAVSLDSSTESDSLPVNYVEEPKKPSNIIEQIGSLFAGFFGFLS